MKADPPIASHESEPPRSSSVNRLVNGIVLLPTRCIIGVVRVYQWTLGLVLGGRCRFHPSCSEYMIQAVRKYGAVSGGLRGIARICRCHPFHPGGYDPP